MYTFVVRLSLLRYCVSFVCRKPWKIGERWENWQSKYAHKKINLKCGSIMDQPSIHKIFNHFLSRKRVILHHTAARIPTNNINIKSYRNHANSSRSIGDNTKNSYFVCSSNTRSMFDALECCFASILTSSDVEIHIERREKTMDNCVVARCNVRRELHVDRLGLAWHGMSVERIVSCE